MRPLRRFGLLILLPFVLALLGVSTPSGAAQYGWSDSLQLSNLTGEEAGIQIATNDSGGAIAIWVEFENGNSTLLASRLTNASTWEAPITIRNSSIGVYYPAVALDDAGNAAAVWLEGGPVVYRVTFAYLDSASGWSAPSFPGDNVSEQGGTQVALDNDGNAVVVWHQRLGDGMGIMVAEYNATTGWSAAVQIDGGDTGAYRPRIASDAAGHVQIMWPNGFRVSLVERQGSGTWTAPSSVGAEYGEAQNAEFAMDGNGDSLAVWISSYPDLGGLYGARYLRGIGWGAATRFSEPLPEQPILHLSMNYDGEAVASWMQSNSSASWGTEAVAARFDPAAGWSAPDRLAQGPGYKEVASAIDADGNVLCVWEYHAVPYFSFRPSNGDWSFPAAIDANSSAYPSQFNPPVATFVGVGDAWAFWTQDFGRAYGSKPVVASRFHPEFVPPLISLTSSSHPLTNNPLVAITGSTEAGARVVAGDNETQAESDGSFLLHVLLSEGNHTFEVRAIDENGNMATAPFQVEVDLTAPTLRIDSPMPWETAWIGYIVIAGSTEPGCEATLGDTALAPAPSGEFRGVASLALGENTISVTATDPAGNVAAATVVVNYDDPAANLSANLAAEQAIHDMLLAELAVAQLEADSPHGFSPLTVSLAAIRAELENVSAELNASSAAISSASAQVEALGSDISNLSAQIANAPESAISLLENSTYIRPRTEAQRATVAQIRAVNQAIGGELQGARAALAALPPPASPAPIAPNSEAFEKAFPIAMAFGILFGGAGAVGAFLFVRFLRLRPKDD